MNSPFLLISCLFLFYKETFFKNDSEVLDKKKKMMFTSSLNDLKLWWGTRRNSWRLFKFKNQEEIKFVSPSVTEKSFPMQ